MCNNWKELIKNESVKPYWQQLMAFLKKEYEQYRIFPPQEDMMKALLLTPLEKVKVVIIGQDPYHEEGQAMGLSFSVHKGQPFPKSLQNIFTELVDDMNVKYPTSGDLTSWANQGVLLLNTILTVRKGQALSHKECGWEIFTDEIIKLLNIQTHKIVFILWGSHAIQKSTLLSNPNHLILSSPHPSPLSAYRGFFGSKPFSKANAFLADEAIDWTLE